MKKKLFFFAVLCCVIISANAQVTQKYFGRAGRSELAMKSVTLTGGTHITVGGAYTGTTSSQTSADAFIYATDAAGNILWSKEIGTTNWDKFMDVTPTSDGGCVAVGFANATGVFSGHYAMAVKFDASGNQLWSKTFNATAIGEIFRHVIEMPGSGHIVCTGDYQFSAGVVGSLVVDMDNSGNMLWSKLYDENSTDEAMGVAALNGHLVMTGFFQGFGSNTYYDGYLVSIDENDGTILWGRSFDYASTINGNTGNAPNDLQVINNKIYIGADLFDNYSFTNTLCSIVQFDTLGLNPICLEIKDALYNVSAPNNYQIAPNGDAYILHHPSNGIPWDNSVSANVSNMVDAVVTKITNISSPTASAVYSKTFSNTGQQELSRIRIENGHIIGVGSVLNDPTYQIGTQDVFQLDADTSFSSPGCATAQSNVQFGNPIVALDTFIFISTSTPAFTAPQLSLTTNSITISSVTPCATALPDIIINTYAAVYSAGTCNAFNVDDATGFNVGDTVLMIQMKGASIDSSNTASFGNVLNYNGAGNYEYNVISAVAGNIITLKYALQRAYDIPNGKVQFVKVPGFQNYTVSQPHTCMPWDGSKGGVFAVNVANALTLNDSINVSGKGFSGGQSAAAYSSSIVCDVTHYYAAPNVDSSAPKGEGIADVSLSKSYGRGKLANGGGGGDAHNGGGGGGANGGSGGLGGKEFSNCFPANSDQSGIGGTALTYNAATNKIFLGGGGGAGHENTNVNSSGGNGGGIVIISAGSILGNSKHISANGSDANACTNNGASGACHDGMGGGGGAGTILLNTPVITGNTNIDLFGGNGGNENALASYGLVGPGAGGGGGIYWTSQATVGSNVSIAENGGANGVITDNSNDPYGAQAGNIGQALTGLQLGFPTIIAPPCNSACNTITLPDSLSACPGNAITLTGTISGTDSVLSINWTPTTGLSNPNSLTPVLTAGNTPGYYYLTVQSLIPTNLVVNGDFSAGNTGFTSAYTYATGPTAIYPDGTYTVTTNPFNNHPQAASFNDHTTGTGNMMAVNGASSPVNVWCQTISVNPNTDYNFAAWFANWSANTSSNLPQLQFEINGTPLGTVFNIPGTQGLWTAFNATWNSGTSTTATICIHDQQTAANGNDFSIDDISFQEICVAKDSVYISPLSAGSFTATSNTPVCSGQTLSLTATSIAGATYNWTGPNGFTATTYNPTITNVTTAATGTYNVSAAISGCNASASVAVTVAATPVANAGNDTLVCPGATFQLNGSGTGNYLWIPATGLSNPQIANPTVSISATTTYSLVVTNTQGCADTDMVTVTIPDASGFYAPPSVTLCKGEVVQLQAAGGTNYFWTPSTGLSANNIPNPIVSVDTDADYQVTISVPSCNLSAAFPVHVAVHAHPPVTATSSNDINCGHNLTVLKAAGALTYVWSPAATLDNPTSATPKATPEVETTYTVVGTDAYGCTAQSDVTVKVTHDGEGRIVEPNAFTPNGDGLNDCFRIELPGSTVSGFELHIFDRWGVEVWHTNSLNDCWDGTFNGATQPLGVYMYYYKAKSSFCGPIQGKGNVTLVR